MVFSKIRGLKIFGKDLSSSKKKPLKGKRRFFSTGFLKVFGKGAPGSFPQGWANFFSGKKFLGIELVPPKSFEHFFNRGNMTVMGGTPKDLFLGKRISTVLWDSFLPPMLHFNPGIKRVLGHYCAENIWV